MKPKRKSTRALVKLLRLLAPEIRALLKDKIR